MSTQAVADLCWVVNTPSLVNGPNVLACPEVSADSIDTEHLDHFLARRPGSYRVGRYFEALVEYWLRHVRNLEIVATSMQLKDGKITVGEIDFLYRDETNVLVHCEATVKFFLCVPGHKPSEFPGPNANDNYEAKLTKLFDQQLGRSEQFVPDVQQRLGLMKGMIFYRNSASEAEVPPRLSPAHQQGGWLRVNELDSLANGAYSIAKKPNWLAPQIDPTLLSKAELADFLRAHFGASDHPVMISSRDTNKTAIEVERLFAVDALWPARP